MRGFHFVKSLKRLYLDRNEFESIPAMAFYPLNDLVELYLHNNRKLTMLHGFAFDGLFALEKCVLSKNPRLGGIDRNAFPVKGLV